MSRAGWLGLWTVVLFSFTSCGRTPEPAAPVAQGEVKSKVSVVTPAQQPSSPSVAAKAAGADAQPKRPEGKPLSAPQPPANADGAQDEPGEESDEGPDAEESADDQEPAAEKSTDDKEPDIYYVPTHQDVVNRMLELAEIKEGDVVYDLGCGDGRIVVTAAQKYGVKAWGFDVDPERIKESLENVEKSGVGKLVTIEKKDIFTLDLSKADVITLYLLPSLNVKLIPQLEKLKPGSRIVSHDFDMEGIKPKTVETVEEPLRKHTVYLWVTPLERE